MFKVVSLFSFSVLNPDTHTHIAKGAVCFRDTLFGHLNRFYFYFYTANRDAPSKQHGTLNTMLYLFIYFFQKYNFQLELRFLKKKSKNFKKFNILYKKYQNFMIFLSNIFGIPNFQKQSNILIVAVGFTFTYVV